MRVCGSFARGGYAGLGWGELDKARQGRVAQAGWEEPEPGGCWVRKTG